MAEQELPLQVEGDAVRRAVAEVERQDDAIPAAAQPAVEISYFLVANVFYYQSDIVILWRNEVVFGYQVRFLFLCL